MPDQPIDRRPHLVLANTSTAQAFTAPPSSGGSSAFPALDGADQERYNLPARYSLIVSIRTPETDVGLYSPFAQQVAAQAAVPVVVAT